jgi:hypothetical protein
MKTYSEQRQETLFAAARKLYRLAGEILDDSVNDVELLSEPTHEWVKATSRKTAEMARELEDQGHGECMASSRSENALYNAKRAHSDAIDRYEHRRGAAYIRKTAAKEVV